MKSIQMRRSELERRFEELTERLKEIDAELDAHQSRDWEELAVEREGDEVLEGMGNAGKSEIRAIMAALARINDGEYGHCVECGDRISEQRLDVLPFTPLCKDCAAKHDKKA